MNIRAFAPSVLIGALVCILGCRPEFHSPERWNETKDAHAYVWTWHDETFSGIGIGMKVEGYQPLDRVFFRVHFNNSIDPVNDPAARNIDLVWLNKSNLRVTYPDWMVPLQRNGKFGPINIQYRTKQAPLPNAIVKRSAEYYKFHIERVEFKGTTRYNIFAAKATKRNPKSGTNIFRVILPFIDTKVKNFNPELIRLERVDPENLVVHIPENTFPRQADPIFEGIRITYKTYKMP